MHRFIKSRKESRCRPFYPTACCELFHITKAVLLACCFQIFLIIIIGITYYYMELNGYFYNVIYFRTVMSVVGLAYFLGICASVSVLHVYSDNDHNFRLRV
ncbi:unnamed protein product [Auanema sp. JU1783]|nr:unnamed protein product [Auanema sp. JU1783]